MFIDSLLKPKSNEDIINNLIKLNQEEKNKKLIYNSAIGQLDLVKYLIEAGTNINVKDMFNKTALMWASQGGHIDIVKLLIESGANMNIKDKYGETALIIAYKHDRQKIVDLLKNYGAK